MAQRAMWGEYEDRFWKKVRQMEETCPLLVQARHPLHPELDGIRKYYDNINNAACGMDNLLEGIENDIQWLMNVRFAATTKNCRKCCIEPEKMITFVEDGAVTIKTGPAGPFKIISFEADEEHFNKLINSMYN